MMRLMQPPIHRRVMQSPMNPVNATIRETHEQRILQPIVGAEGGLVGEVVELGPAAYFGEEERGREYGDYGDGGDALADFLADLVREEVWVAHYALVEECVVDYCAADEV